MLGVHRARQAEAAQYHDLLLQQKLYVSWRNQLQRRKKLGKQAELTETFFIIRRTWSKIKAAQHQRLLQRKADAFMIQRTGKVFRSMWFYI